MHVNQVVEYEPWDLSEPVIPSRSRFYHLEPVAFGTGMVESLTSYFSRLAEAHSISAGTLLHRELLPLKAGRRNMFSCIVSARTRCFTSSINSLGNTATRFASTVGKLTGRNDLYFLTMAPWQTLLPAPLLTRGVAAWCPLCLSSWRDAGKPLYVPLLWALEVVKYCPDHRHPLQMVCPHCQLPQPLLGQCCSIGYCTCCKQWLGVDGSADHAGQYSLVQPEAPEWEVWVANQVRGLILAAFHSSPRLSRQQMSSMLTAATKREGLSGLARLLGVSPNSVNSWRSGKKLPMLPVYVRLARVFNVALADLLTGAIPDEVGLSLNPDDVPYWRNLYIRRQPDFNVVKAKQQLEDALRELPPPSLLSFQKRTGYHYATLHRHFPDLCQALCARFQQDRAASTEERHAEKIVEFRRIAERLHQEGIDLFLNRVFKRMSPPKSLDYRIARDLFAEVKLELLATDQVRASLAGSSALEE